MAEGVQYKGLESLSLGDTNLSLRTRYSVWFLQSRNPHCRVFRRVFGWVYVVPVKKMVGGFVEPVGVLVGVFGYSAECD